MKKGIITVVGKDTIGIMAQVCTYLAEHKINILDISQTIVEDYFNMMMIVDLTNNQEMFKEHVVALEEIGLKMGVQVKLQLEDIFNAMHRI